MRLTSILLACIAACALTACSAGHTQSVVPATQSPVGTASRLAYSPNVYNRVFASTPQFVQSGIAVSAASDGNGYVWYATYTQLERFWGSNILTEPIQTSNNGELLPPMTRGPDGNIWFLVYPRNPGDPIELERVQSGGTIAVFSFKNIVTNVLADLFGAKDGHLYAVTDQGLFSFTTTGTLAASYPLQGMQNMNLCCAAYSPVRNVIYADARSYQPPYATTLYEYSLTGVLARTFPQSIKGSVAFYSTVVAHDGAPWRLVYLPNHTGTCANRIDPVTGKQICISLNLKSGQSVGAQALTVANDGALWAAAYWTNGMGFERIDPKTHAVTVYPGVANYLTYAAVPPPNSHTNVPNSVWFGQEAGDSSDMVEVVY